MSMEESLSTLRGESDRLSDEIRTLETSVLAAEKERATIAEKERIVQQDCLKIMRRLRDLQKRTIHELEKHLPREERETVSVASASAQGGDEEVFIGDL